jgi:hypothetical protein
MSSRAENWYLFFSYLPKNQEVNQKMFVNGFSDLILCHQFSFLQEYIFYPESKLLVLFGGSSEAEVYCINLTSASANFEINIPVWRDLKAVTLVDVVALLSVPDQNPPVLHEKASMHGGSSSCSFCSVRGQHPMPMPSFFDSYPFNIFSRI